MSAQESWMPVKGPELAAKCPRCKTEPLFAMLVDDGKGVDGEKCFACGASWTHQFPLEVATLEGKLARPVQIGAVRIGAGGVEVVAAPSGCDGGHPGCSVCDAATVAEEAPRVTDAELAEVLRLDAEVESERLAGLWYASQGADPWTSLIEPFIAREKKMARELVALRAEVERLRAVEAVKVADVDRVLQKHAAAVGVVGPMPGQKVSDQ